MAYGIHVENPSGQVQIDDSYINYVLVATTSFYVAYTSNYYAYTTGAVNINNYNPQVGDLVAVNTGHVNNWVYATASGVGISYIAWGTGASATYQVKIFRRLDAFNIASIPALPSASLRGYGLDVYKNNGTDLAFSSYFAPMAVTNVLSGSPPFYFSVNGLSTPFITANTGFVKAVTDPPDGQFPGETEYQVVSADATTARTDTASFQGAPNNYFLYPGSVSMLVLK